MRLHHRIRPLLPRDETGQSMVEYALVTALIAVAALVTVQTLGEGIVGVFEGIIDELDSL
ncbi:MAG: Flp family type IVb pilin [Chloroflexi bacterium]|nr:Flp family type IVb pilin [Chloroflexota bacterium]